MKIDKIKNIIEDIISEDITLYNVYFREEFDSVILTVEIDTTLGIGFDMLIMYNNLISDKLDIFIDDKYILEVCSPGLEREVKNKSDLALLIGKYLYIELNDNTYYGYLLTYDDSFIELQTNIKNNITSIKIQLDDILFVRNAVDINGGKYDK